MVKKSKKYIDQNQELLTVLELQLRETREQVNQNASSLGKCFEKLFNSVEKLQQYKNTLKDTTEDYISKECSTMYESIGACITALQSSDAVSQRLEHSYNSVSLIKELNTDLDKCDSELAWSKLKNKVRNSYSIQDEREIFDSVISDSLTSLQPREDESSNGC